MKEKWSYLAGLIDGEGCISIIRSRRSKTDGKTFYYNYSLSVDIFNSSTVLMKWLIQNFGGVYYNRDRKDDYKWKVANNWRPKGAANKKELLLSTLPYLIIKKEQAKIALAYMDLKDENPAEREKLYQQMLFRNRKGKPVETDTQDNSEKELKIQSVLTGDSKSEPVETQAVISSHRDWL